MAKHIYIIAGEKSGDIIGANVINALKHIDSGITISGIGGEDMSSAGLDSHIDYNDLAVMGVSDVLDGYSRIKQHIKTTISDIKEKSPDVVVTIDVQGFSKRIAKGLSDLKIKKIHIVAPTVWAWRSSRVYTYKQLFDSLLCLFPFEPKYFTDVGMDAHFVGHPSVDNNSVDSKDSTNKATFLKKYGIDKNATIIGLMAGSRKGEVLSVLDTYIESCQKLQSQGRNIHIISLVVPASKSVLENALSAANIPSTLVEQDEKKIAFKSCDVALATSGTVTLELAVAGIPMVVGYKTSFMTYCILRYFIKLKHFSLPNIVLKNKAIVPEFLQADCNVDNLATALNQVLDVDSKKQQKLFLKLSTDLKSPKGTMGLYSAEKILEIISK